MLARGRILKVSETYRGVVHHGTVMLSEEVPLADGTEVLVTPILREPGNAAAVLAAMNSLPRVPAEWVDELEQLIVEGQRSPSKNRYNQWHGESRKPGASQQP